MILSASGLFGKALVGGLDGGLRRARDVQSRRESPVPPLHATGHSGRYHGG